MNFPDSHKNYSSKIYKVLVFPGGTEIGLEINQALKYCKNVRLFSAGSNVSNHAPFVFKNHFIIPSISNKKWLEIINKIIIKNKIDFIFPAHDDVIVALAKNIKKLKATPIISPIKTCKILRSKRKTIDFFSRILPVPELYDDISSIKKWPVFIKPDVGQGSQNTFLVHNIKEASCVLANNKNSVISEYLPGREYTIDCLNDMSGKLMFCSGRERIRIRNGISMNTKIIENKIWNIYAEKICKKIKICGAWFFQLKESTFKTLKLLEIAPRIGGTSCVNRVRGINFPLLDIYIFDHIPVSLLINNYNVEVDRALKSVYHNNLKFDNIIVDYDDTIVLSNKVNVELLSFLYQCKNQGKKIILITKSKKNINLQLEKFCISEKLFSKIIQIKKNESKSYLLRNEITKSSIFIDDSFSERKEIMEKYKILTFDNSMIELLFNYQS